jgi:hypothetical protein
MKLGEGRTTAVDLIIVESRPQAGDAPSRRASENRARSRSLSVVNSPIGVHGRYILLRAANVRVSVMYLQKIVA